MFLLHPLDLWWEGETRFDGRLDNEITGGVERKGQCLAVPGAVLIDAMEFVGEMERAHNRPSPRSPLVAVTCHVGPIVGIFEAFDETAKRVTE